MWCEHRLNLQALKVFGKVFSSEGILPDPDKVAAVKAAGPPQSAAKVHLPVLPRSKCQFYGRLEYTSERSDQGEYLVSVDTRVPKVI